MRPTNISITLCWISVAGPKTFGAYYENLEKSRTIHPLYNLFENNIAYEFASWHRVSNHSNNLVWYIKTNRRELHSSGETLCMAFRDKIEYKNLKALGDN